MMRKAGCASLSRYDPGSILVPKLLLGNPFSRQARLGDNLFVVLISYKTRPQLSWGRNCVPKPELGNEPFMSLWLTQNNKSVGSTGFPACASSTFRAETKVLDGTGILPVMSTGWKPVPPNV